MLETIKAQIVTMNIFQLRELSSAVNTRIVAVSGPLSVPAMPTGLMIRATFKVGDLVNWTSRKTGLLMTARVEKVNSVNLSVRLTDATRAKWRVAPSFCRLVGADKVLESMPKIAAIPASSIGAASTAAGAGFW